MMGFQDMILIGEIALQIKIAQRASERLQSTHQHFDNVETWCSIQSILVATGNVSKILWPNKKYKERGERLRQLLKVENDNPLSTRDFRNHFEHYDERVEEWFLNVSGGVYDDLHMNPHLSSAIFGIEPSFTHRGYNSFNNTLVFRGEVLDLNELLNALKEIYNNCNPYTLL
jgi:hypothetical protein